MTFTENDYGYEKSIWDALLFRKDMTKASAKQSQSDVDWNRVLRKTFFSAGTGFNK